MDSFDTIKILKEKIHAKSNIAIGQMNLYFGSQELRNDADTLEDCGLDDDSPIHVVQSVTPRLVLNAIRPGTYLIYWLARILNNSFRWGQSL